MADATTLKAAQNLHGQHRLLAAACLGHTRGTAATNLAFLPSRTAGTKGVAGSYEGVPLSHADSSYCPCDAAASPLYREVLASLETYLAERFRQRDALAQPCAESALRAFLRGGPFHPF